MVPLYITILQIEDFRALELIMTNLNDTRTLTSSASRPKSLSGCLVGCCLLCHSNDFYVERPRFCLKELVLETSFLSRPKNPYESSRGTTQITE